MFSTKRCIAILLALVLFLSVANAEINATSGDGQTTVVFYVLSQGNATVSFSQTKGKCKEKSLSSLWAGTEEWGKYHFDITAPNGQSWRKNWDNTFVGGSFELSLGAVGTYMIKVTPYTDKEINDSWSLDHFYEWITQPKWKISDTRNCNAYSLDPRCRIYIECYDRATNQLLDSSEQTIFSTTVIYPPAIDGYYCGEEKYISYSVGSSASFKFYYDKIEGKVYVECYDSDGHCFEGYTEIITSSQNLYPRQFSGYTAISSSEYVKLDPPDKCTPVTIKFYYSKNSGPTKPTSKPVVTDTPTPGPVITNPPTTPPQTMDDVPEIWDRVIRRDERHSAVTWVQANLKKTGEYYQGDNWKVSGKLGDHTMEEIRRFMRDRGYSNHTGEIDQNVINTLYNFLNGNNQPSPPPTTKPTSETNNRQVPDIRNRVIKLNENDSAVTWVQENLKKTGKYYQGDSWKVTGHLGNHTKQEVQRFMKDQGYSNHTGEIDQNVINTLYDYLHR